MIYVANGWIKKHNISVQDFFLGFSSNNAGSEIDDEIHIRLASEQQNTYLPFFSFFLSENSIVCLDIFFFLEIIIKCIKIISPFPPILEAGCRQMKIAGGYLSLSVRASKKSQFQSSYNRTPNDNDVQRCNLDQNCSRLA